MLHASNDRIHHDIRDITNAHILELNIEPFLEKVKKYRRNGRKHVKNCSQKYSLTKLPCIHELGKEDAANGETDRHLDK